jgi:hypothetical protein
MTGVSKRNWVMFRKLCGEWALKNVVIVTNMWGDVDPRIGNAREAELIRDVTFFKPVFDKGARITRHDNTLHSAQEIIRLLFNNDPLPLNIQEELFNDISETDAGKELYRELTAVIRKYELVLQEMRTGLQQAMKENDEETKMELEFETRAMTTVIQKFRNEIGRLELVTRIKEGERLRDQ